MNPSMSMWVNIAVTAISGLAGSAALFSDLFGEGPAKKIVAALSLAGVVLGSINAALHAASTSQPGPMGK